MERLCCVNGSPRGNNSASQYFIDEICKLVDNSKYEIYKTNLNNKIDYEKIIDSEILILTFPLYVDCLPSIMIEFLENLERYIEKGKKALRVYAIVNCGFFEGIQNRHALQIIQNFCYKVGYEWRFGIGIGAGEFMRGTKENIPLKSKVKLEIYEALVRLGKDMSDNKKDIKENVFLSPKFPKFLYITAGNKGWIKEAKINSVSKKQLYAKTFIDNIL